MLKISTNAWSFVVPVIPTNSTTNTGSTLGQSMTIQCQKVSSPIGYNIQPVKVNMQRLVYNYAGGLEHKQELDLSFFDTYDSSVYQILQAWRDYTVDYNSGLNYSKNTYATTAFLYHLGVNGDIAIQYQLNNAWVMNITGTDYVVGPKSQLFEYRCKLVFDFLTNPLALSLGNPTA
jgi:hypothetical protein